jgi:hypothetical protein
MMSLFNAPHTQFLLIAGYVLCFVALNMISFLISLFYRKKLQQSSPRWGFLIAILLAFLFFALLLGARNGSSLLATIGRLSIVGSVIASAISTMSLFFVMRKVRK